MWPVPGRPPSTTLESSDVSHSETNDDPRRPTPGREPKPSPAAALTPMDVAVAGTSLAEVHRDGSHVYWWERRPTEGGRGVVVGVDDDGAPLDVSPPGVNVRTLVHEYGGGAWDIRANRLAYVDLADQAVHLVDLTTAPGEGTGRRATRVTDPGPVPGAVRYADLTWHPDGIHVIAVRENHHPDTDPVNDLVAVDTVTGVVTVLAEGHDFYAMGRPSPDGARVAYIAWDQPDMPWDSTELHLGLWRPGRALADDRVVAGGPGEAVQQPVWSPTGELLTITDRTGWWLPSVVDLSGQQAPRPLIEAEMDFGEPMWVFGLGTMCVDDDGSLVLSWHQEGFGRIGRLRGGKLTPFPTPRIEFGRLALDGEGSVLTTAASPTRPTEVVAISESGAERIIRPADTDPLDPGMVSVAEHIDFPSDGRTAHALLYRPRPHPAGGPPPLLVLSHGGPTAAARPGYNPAVQFWTTRGFMVADVNYGGSTGYGRAYRELLNHNWGIVDRLDCVNLARHLVDEGLVDPNALAIKGGSAGGFTTLSALTFNDDFTVGASRYGVGDLETLATDTHKFEARYLDSLIGPYPERRDLYRERSPVNHTELLNTPMAVLQGLEDRVVPPSQSEAMVAALDSRGVPYVYITFEGEQHGFRQAPNIARALEVEYLFFCRIFGIPPAGPIGSTAGLDIHNLG